MNIEEARELKIKSEKDIKKIIDDFENKTHLFVAGLRMSGVIRKRKRNISLFVTLQNGWHE